MNKFTDLPTDELIILRESLTDYLVNMRRDPVTEVVTSHDAYLKRDISPRARGLYLAACDLRQQVNAVLVHR